MRPNLIATLCVSLCAGCRSQAPAWTVEQTPDQASLPIPVHELPQKEPDARVIARDLDRATNAAVRRSLILALGHYPSAAVSDSLRREVATKLLRWYGEDPDAGVHSAIDWLLRHDRRGDRLRPLDWRSRDLIEALDRMLASRRVATRGWVVTGEGHTMAVVRGPIEFVMGAPADEPGRAPAPDSPDEPQHRVRIPRSFAIGTKEVTVAQFRRFLDANPEIRRRHTYPGRPDQMANNMARLSPDDHGPQIAVTWYEAAMYCNWLSKREGLPEREWVYASDPLDIRGGMVLPSDYLQRTGYRLPTEAEWELATRAGSTTARFFGTSAELLAEYAWYAAKPPRSKDEPLDPNDPQRTWPVGQLEPNDFGLFDVYGNVWEWTQNRIDLQIPAMGPRIDSEDAERVVHDTVARPRRGGAFMYESSFMRSANRGTRGAHPTTRRDNVGFRVARTLRTVH